MPLSAKLESLINGLPDEAGARRFYAELAERYPSEAASAFNNEALLSDMLTLAAFSPLLAATILHNPSYISWLGRERRDVKVRSREELLESLARFALTHSELPIEVMLARFRRRELLRIYLRDIRRLATVTEITEELSNLADAVLEYALRDARREMDNRFGSPLETDEKGRLTPAGFCVIALGKLGARELNYSSDIDLLFIYSADGSTSGHGSRGVVTNREYFVKMAEYLVRNVGRQSGEGAAFRIDMRLRPHGSIGALALSLAETVRYYRDEARDWERQVLIRSRASAGDLSLYREFFDEIGPTVFRRGANAAECLANVRRAKQLIDDTSRTERGFNVKLGTGGIREIEFIAQALQLAYGGEDEWLRSSHTLVSLARLADRDLVHERELTELFDAYDFLRRVEHRLQMEHGLQTHSIPDDPKTRQLVSARMGCKSLGEFDRTLARHTENAHRVYSRIFKNAAPDAVAADGAAIVTGRYEQTALTEGHADLAYLKKFAAISPFLSRPSAIESPIDLDRPPTPGEIRSTMLEFTGAEADLGRQFGSIRRAWSRIIVRIAAADAARRLTMTEAKSLQTLLAEASVEAALAITNDELLNRLGSRADDLSVLALGKLGGRGVDYGSDLDLVLVYDALEEPGSMTPAELHSQAVELFVNALSGVTRDGSLYRVDLRLRPYGKNGASSNPKNAFIEYFTGAAAIWELLAFVKLRGVTGKIAASVETQVRNIIHRRALEADPDEIRSETLRIRYLLERQKAGKRSALDIKYGPGGMLDVYFATRFLQLRDNVPDDDRDRATIATLDRLLEHGSLSSDVHDALSSGYAFLSELDHHIRLVSGRSARLPVDAASLQLIAERMDLPRPTAIAESLTFHRLNIREAFDRVVAR